MLAFSQWTGLEAYPYYLATYVHFIRQYLLTAKRGVLDFRKSKSFACFNLN